MGETQSLTMAPVMRQTMNFRCSPEKVFDAFVDPQITTRFWFSHGSGPLAPGAHVQWVWELAGGMTVDLFVEEFAEDQRLVYRWGIQDDMTTVEWDFEPTDQGCRVIVTEQGYLGSSDEQVARALDSMGGFTMVLCSAKALLEQQIDLMAVPDHIRSK